MNDDDVIMILTEPDKYKDQILNYIKNFNSKSESEMRKMSLYLDRCFLSGWISNQIMYNHRLKLKIINRLEIPSSSDFENFIELRSIIDLKEWYPCNPSICQTSDGYYLLKRLVNFSSTRATNYISHSKDGKFSTRNLLLTLDQNFKILKWIEIQDLSNRKIFPKHVQGLEDIQIFQIKEKNKKNKGKRLGFVCTLVDCQKDGTPLMGFGLININTGKISKIKALRPPFPHNCEKNWLPRWVGGKINGGIELLYHGAQMTRLRFSMDQYYSDSGPGNFDHKNEIQTILSDAFSEKRKELRDVRGGAWISFENGFLLLFHEVIWIFNGRTYIHRFVQTDQNFQVLKISHSFTFEHKDIEFARSMCWNLKQDEILIGVGIDDHFSYLYQVSPEIIKNMLIFP